jgi:hypothetical protein
MVEDRDNIVEKEVTDAELEWEGLSQLKAERDDVKLPDDVDSDLDDGSGTLSQRMSTSPKLSDFQTLDFRLSPTLKAKWLEDMRVSRVFPEAFPHLLRLFIKELMCEFTEMSLGEATAQVYHALSTGIDGEGRIDEIMAYTGSASGEKDESKRLLGS